MDLGKLPQASSSRECVYVCVACNEALSLILDTTGPHPPGQISMAWPPLLQTLRDQRDCAGVKALALPTANPIRSLASHGSLSTIDCDHPHPLPYK